MFVIPDESFRILSAECVVWSSDLLPAPLFFQRSMVLAIEENVLQTRRECLDWHYFPSVLLQFFGEIGVILSEFWESSRKSL